MDAAALHRLLSAAEEAAANCDGGALRQRVTELDDAFAALMASPTQHRSPNKMDLQGLQRHVHRYAQLCAALGQSLRAALTQSSLTDGMRYEARGTARTTPTRHLIGGYG